MDYRKNFFKAAVLKKKNVINIIKLRKPSKLNKGQIFVKLFYSSICNTQLQEIEMKKGKDKYLPHCLGHEGVGEVKSVFSGCRNFKIGDKVCLTWVKSGKTMSNGNIYYDLSGNKINSGPVHTLNEYAVVDQSRIFKLRDSKNLRNKVLLGCAMPTTYNILNENKFKKNSTICVFGGGGLGISFILIAKRLGYKKIFLVENHRKKREFLKKKFRIPTFDTIDDVKNDYYDVAVECTGNITVFKNIIKKVKKFGGKVVVVGNYSKKLKSHIDPWDIIEGKSLQGAWLKQIEFNGKFTRLQKIFKGMNTNFYFSNKTYKLEEINKAILDFKKGKVFRPLIKF